MATRVSLASQNVRERVEVKEKERGRKDSPHFNSPWNSPFLEILDEEIYRAANRRWRGPIHSGWRKFGRWKL